MGNEHVKPQKFFGNTKDKNITQNSQTSGPKIKVKLMIKLKNIESGEFSYRAYSISSGSKALLVESEKKMAFQNTVTFETFFIMDYYFEKQQPLTIEINKGNEIEVFKTNLGNIVGSRNNTLKKKIKESKKEMIEISSLELKGDSNNELRFNFEVSIEPEISFSKDKYRFYYEISNSSLLYRSELLSTKGQFFVCGVPVSLLLPQFTINFINLKKTKVQHTITTTPSEFISQYQSIRFQTSTNHFINIKNKSKIKGAVSFLDYLHHGLEINLTIGIDFTGSNGSPNQKTSLHSIVSPCQNDYENAIKSCGNIVSEYDSDQLFPVYGFGAKLKGESKVSMCFNLNMKNNPDIHTIDNILVEYRKNVPTLKFYGPTCFGPVIQRCIDTIKEENNKLKYNILMILTDGIIDDMPETIELLVQGSFMPLSVIIIGIGDADFTDMEKLDADDNPLVSKGVKSGRDLVQFVPYNKFKGDYQKLAEEVLQEIPTQILEFYQMNDIEPEQISNRRT